MRSIPVAVEAMTFLVVAVTAAEERVNPDDSRSVMRPRVNVDGEAVWRVQCLVKVDDPAVVDADELRGEMLDVSVPGARPTVGALEEVVFDGLVARQWALNNRSGISFSARAVAKAGAANGRRQPAPAVPGSTDGGS